MFITKLHSNGTAKFVLLLDEDKNFILRSDLGADLHRHIVEKEKEETGKIITCLGGGRIKISDDEIYAYGKSLDFGVANNYLVGLILKDFEFDKSIKIEMGVGY